MKIVPDRDARAAPAIRTEVVGGNKSSIELAWRDGQGELTVYK